MGPAPLILANLKFYFRIARMIERRTKGEIDRALTRQAGVVLIGPRQVGKTTLALDIADDRDAPYLDPESAADRQCLHRSARRSPAGD